MSSQTALNTIDAPTARLIDRTAAKEAVSIESYPTSHNSHMTAWRFKDGSLLYRVVQPGRAMWYVGVMAHPPNLYFVWDQ